MFISYGLVKIIVNKVTCHHTRRQLYSVRGRNIYNLLTSTIYCEW